MHDAAIHHIHTLSLHDALPIFAEFEFIHHYIICPVIIYISIFYRNKAIRQSIHAQVLLKAEIFIRRGKIDGALPFVSSYNVEYGTFIFSQCIFWYGKLYFTYYAIIGIYRSIFSYQVSIYRNFYILGWINIKIFIA